MMYAFAFFSGIAAGLWIAVYIVTFGIPNIRLIPWRNEQ